MEGRCFNNTRMRDSCTALFCFGFRISSVILGRVTKILHFGLLLWGVLTLVSPLKVPPPKKKKKPSLVMESAACLINSSPDLWLLKAVSCPGPVTSELCDLNGYAAYAESALCFPFHMRKAGAKSHFENVLLSACDTSETTLLI